MSRLPWNHRPVGRRALRPNGSDDARGSITVETRHSDGRVVVEHIYRCAHCKEFQGKHADGKHCLFLPTTFQAMTEKEAEAAFAGTLYPTTVTVNGSSVHLTAGATIATATYSRLRGRTAQSIIYDEALSAYWLDWLD